MNTKQMPKPNEALHEFFKDNEVFADVFNSGLFRGECIIDPNNLKPVDTAYIETIPKGKKKGKINRYRDVARSTITSKGEFILLGIENQDAIHYSMPIRKMLYDALGYSGQVTYEGNKQNQSAWDVDERLSHVAKGTKIKPIITLVFYTGETKWDGPRSLYEMMDFDENLKTFIPNYPLFVIDLGHDKNLSFSNEDLAELKTALSLIYSKQSEAEHAEVSNKVLSLTGILANDAELYQEANEKTEGGKRDMCQALMERDRRSREAGRLEGRLEGKRESLQQAIENLMQSIGCTYEQALKNLGIPSEDWHLYHP